MKTNQVRPLTVCDKKYYIVNECRYHYFEKLNRFENKIILN